MPAVRCSPAIAVYVDDFFTSARHELNEKCAPRESAARLFAVVDACDRYLFQLASHRRYNRPRRLGHAIVAVESHRVVRYTHIHLCVAHEIVDSEARVKWFARNRNALGRRGNQRGSYCAEINFIDHRIACCELDD